MIILKLMLVINTKEMLSISADQRHLNEYIDVLIRKQLDARKSFLIFDYIDTNCFSLLLLFNYFNSVRSCT